MAGNDGYVERDMPLWLRLCHHLDAVEMIFEAGYLSLL
jgi:hypothetical protein